MRALRSGLIRHQAHPGTSSSETIRPEWHAHSHLYTLQSPLQRDKRGARHDAKEQRTTRRGRRPRKRPRRKSTKRPARPLKERVRSALARSNLRGARPRAHAAGRQKNAVEVATLRTGTNIQRTACGSLPTPRIRQLLTTYETCAVSTREFPHVRRGAVYIPPLARRH